MPLGRPLHDDRLMYSRVLQFLNSLVRVLRLTELPQRFSFLKKKMLKMNTSSFTYISEDLFFKTAVK